MSYNIIYDKCFVKVTEDLYMPFIKIGCNNVTDYKGKRERSWKIVSFYNPSKILYTEKELVDNTLISIKDRLDGLTREYATEEYRQMDEKYNSNDYNHKWSLEDYVYDGLTILSKSARYKDIFNMYKNGVKNAISLDDFLSLNNLVLGYSTFEGKDFYKRKTIKTREDILELADEFLEKKKISKKTIYLDVDINYDDDCKIKKVFKEKNIKPKREYDHYYVLYNNIQCNYFKKISSAHIWLSGINGAKKFKTENSAKKYLDKYKMLSKYEIKRVDEKIML